MFCPNCGTQLSDDVNFCSSCGNKINFKQYSAATSANGNSEPDPKIVEQMNQILNKQAKEPPIVTITKWSPIVKALAVIFAVIQVVEMFYFFDDSDPSKISFFNIYYIVLFMIEFLKTKKEPSEAWRSGWPIIGVLVGLVLSIFINIESFSESFYLMFMGTELVGSAVLMALFYLDKPHPEYNKILRFLMLAAFGILALISFTYFREFVAKYVILGDIGFLYILYYFVLQQIDEERTKLLNQEIQ